jgi:hypothetical protein
MILSRELKLKDVDLFRPKWAYLGPRVRSGKRRLCKRCSGKHRSGKPRSGNGRLGNCRSTFDNESLVGNLVTANRVQ